MKISSTIATTMIMAASSHAFDVEQETTDLWTLPFDKILPDQPTTEEPDQEPEDPVVPDPTPVDPSPQP